MSSVRGLIALLAVIPAGCATEEPYRLDGPKVVAGLELAPYAIHEECVTLQTTQGVSYFFSSRGPVAFNVHFHDGNAVVMPIDRQPTTEESGDFTADRDQVYCLMWENGPDANALDYRLRPLPRT